MLGQNLAAFTCIYHVGSAASQHMVADPGAKGSAVRREFFYHSFLRQLAAILRPGSWNFVDQLLSSRISCCRESGQDCLIL